MYPWSLTILQVQQKLSVEEYTEFVDLMKALKSKTMKVMSVLESIARLFSGPGRFFLLERYTSFMRVICL